jgi:hypothetical protein
MQTYNSTSYASPINKAEILDQINSEREVIRMINNFLGIAIVEAESNGMRKMVNRRICRPTFTYEFTHQLKGLIDGFLNFAIQVSRWEAVTINTHLNRVGNHLTLFLATSGDDNYISEESWNKIIEIQRSEGGWRKFNITWDYDNPVTYPMLTLVRELDEEADQDIFFSLVVKEVLALIQGSMNKGFAMTHDSMGQLPKLMSEIKQEQSVIRDSNAQNVQSMTGGNNQWN